MVKRKWGIINFIFNVLFLKLSVYFLKKDVCHIILCAFFLIKYLIIFDNETPSLPSPIDGEVSTFHMLYWSGLSGQDIMHSSSPASSGWRVTGVYRIIQEAAGTVLSFQEYLGEPQCRMRGHQKDLSFTIRMLPAGLGSTPWKDQTPQQRHWSGETVEAAEVWPPLHCFLLGGGTSWASGNHSS